MNAAGEGAACRTRRTITKDFPGFHRPSVVSRSHLVALFIFTHAASVQTHLLRQEVRGQRQSGDHQPAGLLPVWCVPLGHPQSSGLLGKYLRAADGRPRQPLRFSRQPLQRLCPYGTDPRCQLTAGKSERQQLQVRPTQVQSSTD